MLKNKNAIITGARRGIGRASVEVFASHGANIWACARAQDDTFEADMRSVAEKYGVSIWPVYFDVTNTAQVKEAVQVIRKQNLNIHALINVAGISSVGSPTSFPMTSLEKMKQVMDTNLFSVVLLTQYVSRLMAKQNGGSIVNMASISGLDSTTAQFEYAASKGAIIAGTRNLARALSPFNIRVNAVAPGLIETDMTAAFDKASKEALLSTVLMGRMGTADEIAEVIAFLASDLSSYMTGQIIRVDGGM